MSLVSGLLGGGSGGSISLSSSASSAAKGGDSTFGNIVQGHGASNTKTYVIAGIAAATLLGVVLIARSNK